jgi:hypothetical protein
MKHSLAHIEEIAASIGIPADALTLYGRHKAKRETSAPLAVGKATPCALSAIFWRVGPRPRIRPANPQASVFGAQRVKICWLMRTSTGKFFALCVGC